MDGADLYKGYRGPGLAVLKRFGVKVWSDVLLETSKGARFEGIILPRSENADDAHIVLKLHNGYNTGVHHTTVVNIEERGYREARYEIPAGEFPYHPDKPNVTLLGTGGTIASRLDYRTGAVIPAFAPGELYSAVPEIADICNMKTEKLFGIFSENMGPTQYVQTAEAIGRAIRAGADGIIVGHGTDTMHHTAAALSFMVQNSPVPIVMVGSQRSSDRPSSDAAFNLLCASYVAGHSDIAEVTVCMFGPTSDQYNLLHRGTRVRKMHSSHRDTFRTIGDRPLAMVTPQGLTPLLKTYAKRRDDHNVTVDACFEEKVTLLYFYPNMQPDIVDALVDHGYKGIVIAGTGLGHVNRGMFDAFKRACAKGVAVYMTVQTLWGFTQMYVYDTGRDLLDLGVKPLGNMLPEVAYIKLCWALGHAGLNETALAKMMQEPIAGETSDREPHDGYLVLQGGVPEVEQFISNTIR